MDIKNLFHTRTTYNLQRLDYLALFTVSVVLTIVHWGEIRWGAFMVAIVYPDLLGYVPGAINYHVINKGAEHRKIPKIYYVLYNVTHSVAFNVGVFAIWFFVHGGWEWAMMALPLHFGFDRSIFGNFYKPYGVAFEPVPHPRFVSFDNEFQRSGDW